MIKNVVVRFSVEDVDLPALLKRLFLINGSCGSAVIEDFYVPCGDFPFKSDVFRDPKSGWPVNE